jgi:hypothetical protein
MDAWLWLWLGIKIRYVKGYTKGRTRVSGEVRGKREQVVYICGYRGAPNSLFQLL